MSELAHYYLNRPLLSFFAICLVVIGFLTYSQPNIWFYVYLSFILIIATLFRDNQDLLSILFILLFDLALAEFKWNFQGFIYEYRQFLYLLTAATCIICFYDSASKLAFLTLCLVVAGEVYWIVTGYEKKPIISHFIFNLMQLVVMRFLVWNRTRLLSERLFFKQLSFVISDWYLNNLLMVLVVLNCADIIEYLVRHIFFINSLIIYKAFPYVSHAVGVAYVLVVLLVSFQTSSKKVF